MATRGRRFELFSLCADYLRYPRGKREKGESEGELWMLVAMELTLLAEIPELPLLLLLLANLAGWQEGSSCHF